MQGNEFVCFLCGKKIDVQKYEVHVSFCTGKGTNKLLFDPSKMAMPGPRSIQCYICGKAFFKSSIDIHLKSCIQAWEKREAEKPVGKRRPVPNPPKGYEEIKKNLDKVKPMPKPQASEEPMYAPYDDEEFIDNAFKDWMSKALVACSKCGRKFVPESLRVHARACDGAEFYKGKKQTNKK